MRRTRMVFALLPIVVVSGFGLSRAQSTRDVKVVNPPAEPVPVIADATEFPRKRITLRRGFVLSDGIPAFQITLLTAPSELPDGFTFVSEMISYRLILPAGQLGQVSLTAFGNGDPAPRVSQVFMPLANPMVLPSGDWSIQDARNVTMIFQRIPGDFDDDGALTATVSRTTASGQTSVNISVVGYVIPNDSPTLSP